MNSKFEKNCTFQNFYTLGSYQSASSEASQKCALNESYTISNNFNDRKKLHVILEETFELSSSLDRNNFPYSCNTSGSNLNDVTYHEIKSSVSNQVNDISWPNLKVLDESELVESDDSLGILPLAILEDMTLDNLIPDKPSANLNTTIDNMDKGQFISCFSDKSASILPLTVLASSTFTEIPSPICIKPNVSFLCDQSEESPIQDDESFPKFASTPKHETDFSDHSVEIADALNNISSEFHWGIHDLEKEIESLAEPNLKDGTHIQASLHSKPLSECVLQEVESCAKNFHNVTLTHHEQSYNELCFEIGHRVSKKSSEKSEILNTTYEKLDISPDLNKSIKSVQYSKQSVIALKESTKTTQFTKKIIKNKHVSVAALNLSFTKEESKSTLDRRNKFRKSVGCFGASNTKVDNCKKQVRRNSLTNSFNTSNDDFPKTKVMKFSRSKTLSFKCPTKTSGKISKADHKILDWNSDLNKSKTIFKQPALKSESSNYKIEEVKLQQNQENLLNETICLDSNNHSYVENSVFDHKNLVELNLTGNLNEKIPSHSALKVNLQNKKIEKNLIPKMKFSNSQEHLLNETICLISPSSEIGKTIAKKPKNSINFSLLGENNLELNKEVEENLIPKTKLPDSQENFLNETICLTLPNSEIGKTIVKKPRNSINFSLLTKNYLKPNKKVEEDSIPKTKLSDSQENFLNETISLTPPNSEIVKTIVKKSRNSVNFPLLRKNTLKPNKNAEDHLIPNAKLSDCQENFLNETISLTPPSSEIGKTIVKKPRNSINFPLLRKNNLKPNQKVEENFIPKIKLLGSQKNFLNETISLTPPSSEVGKTIVKKPRSSINLSLLKKNNLENCENMHGKNKAVCENNTIPSKQKGRRSFSITQNKESQVKDMNMLNKTLKKPSVASAVAVNEKNNIARLHDKHFSEKNTYITVPLSEVNFNRPVRQYSAIPARKPVCVTKTRANDILISKKSVNEAITQNKVNLNETITLPGSETDFNKNFAAPRYANANQEVSKLPISKIPSAQVCKMAQVKTGDGFLSTLQSSSKQEKSSHKMIPRSISSTRKIKSPRYNCI